jgi:hypothetical protein
LLKRGFAGPVAHFGETGLVGGEFGVEGGEFYVDAGDAVVYLLRREWLVGVKLTWVHWLTFEIAESRVGLGAWFLVPKSRFILLIGY